MGFLRLHESFYSFIRVVSTILFENVQKCRRRQEKESKIKKKKKFQKNDFRSLTKTAPPVWTIIVITAQSSKTN